VLVVVDQPPLADTLCRALGQGPALARTCRNLAEAAEVLADWRPHLVVIDLDDRADPLLDRLGVASGLLERIPVIALIRRGDLRTMLSAFERGADDIVSVPFSAEELVARALAVIGRTYHQAVTVTATIRLGELEVDILHRCARIGTRELHLTSVEQSLLYLLATNAGRVVTRNEIQDHLWGADYAAESNVVDRHVRSLRAKLQDDWRRPRYIATVPGLGYRFEPPPADAPTATQPSRGASSGRQVAWYRPPGRMPPPLGAVGSV